MKTLVLGGGVVGVTTAYFLAKAGHEVTVVEEKDGLGLEATAANAGIIAPGHSFAWASPRAPRMLWQSLRGAETAIRVRLAPDLRLYTWGLRFLRECTAERARRNTLIKLRLCQYSRAVMNALAGAESVEYPAIAQGALYLYRDPAELEAGTKKMALLAERGQKQEILDARAVAKLDPVFEPVRHKIAGAIRDVGDSSGDARLFVENLARVCREKVGVVVRVGVRRLRLGLDAAGLQQHSPARPRSLLRRRRLRPGPVPRVSAADDARRAADPRTRPAPQPLPQLRARPHGLDDGLRHRADRRRPDDRAHARARPGGSDPPAVSAEPTPSSADAAAQHSREPAHVRRGLKRLRRRQNGLRPLAWQHAGRAVVELGGELHVGQRILRLTLRLAHAALQSPAVVEPDRDLGEPRGEALAGCLLRVDEHPHLRHEGLHVGAADTLLGELCESHRAVQQRDRDAIGHRELALQTRRRLVVDELVRRQVADAALDGHDRLRVDRVLLRQRQRRVERLVRARARREALDPDARVHEIVRRAEAGGRQLPCRSAAPSVGGAEAVAVLERPGISREARLREEGRLGAASGGVADVQRLAVGPEIRLDPARHGRGDGERVGGPLG